VFVENTVVKAGGGVLRYGWFYGPVVIDDLAGPVQQREGRAGTGLAAELPVVASGFCQEAGVISAEGHPARDDT
jgi:hypothetical protein